MTFGTHSIPPAPHTPTVDSCLPLATLPLLPGFRASPPPSSVFGLKEPYFDLSRWKTSASFGVCMKEALYAGHAVAHARREKML